MARTNQMQDTLIPGFDGEFGQPVSLADAVKISGQRAQVEAIMAAGYWHTIPNLQRELKRRFGSLYAETSISARLRGLRRLGYKVESRRTRPGSGLYEYRAQKLTPEEIAIERQRTANVLAAHRGITAATVTTPSTEVAA